MDDHPEHKRLSFEYVRGLVEGEGCFTFCTNTQKLKNGNIIKWKIPTFAISMHERDQELLRIFRNTLNLHNSVLIYDRRRKGGYNRGRMAVLMVRDFKSIKDIIIPLFYKKLLGYKGKQFDDWLEKINLYPDVPAGFKYLYKIYKEGIYDKNSLYL